MTINNLDLTTLQRTMKSCVHEQDKFTRDGERAELVRIYKILKAAADEALKVVQRLPKEDK